MKSNVHSTIRMEKLRNHLLKDSKEILNRKKITYIYMCVLNNCVFQVGFQ